MARQKQDEREKKIKNLSSYSSSDVLRQMLDRGRIVFKGASGSRKMQRIVVGS